MILGAVIIGVAIGSAAAVVAVIGGAGLVSAFWTYCVVGAGTAMAVCILRGLFCRGLVDRKIADRGPERTPAAPAPLR